MTCVLLTGGTGFLGARVAAKLLGSGYRVSVLARPDSALDQLERAAGKVDVIRCEVAARCLRDAVAAIRPDAVVHLASVSRGGEDVEAVARMLEANVTLPTLLLAAMREHGVGVFVNTGTSWQNSAGDGYSPFNVYAGTKQALEALLDCFCADGMRAATLRLFDIYGPGDARGKIVDLIATATLRGTTLAMSPGAQVIDLVHVEDAAEAFRVALRHLLARETGGHEVFGVSGERLTLRELARRIGAAAGRDAPIDWGGRPYRPREIMRPWDGYTPLPGWHPAIALDDGLRGVIEAHLAAVA